jgi:hypothetical protein
MLGDGNSGIKDTAIRAFFMMNAFGSAQPTTWYPVCITLPKTETNLLYFNQKPIGFYNKKPRY